MTVLVTGISHHHVSSQRLGEFKIVSDELDAVLHRAARKFDGAVVLSTCNRTEVYVELTGHPAPEQAARRFFATLDRSDLVDDSRDGAYTHADRAAVGHLARVCSGLDSAIVGEPHISGQVADAFAASVDAGAATDALRAMFHHAMISARRIRRRAGLSCNQPSIVSRALALASSELNGLRGKDVMVVGAGALGRQISRGVRRRGASSIFVASRTHQRAIDLSSQVGGQAVTARDMADAMATVDLIVTCTSSQRHVLTARDIGDVMGRRPKKPLLILDLAVPADVESAAGDIEGVTLFYIDSLADGSGRPATPDQARSMAELLIDEAAGRFRFPDETRSGDAFVRDLALLAEDVRRSEFERTLPRLAALSPSSRYSVEQMSKAIVRRILAGPIQYAKHQRNVEGLQLASELFGLEADETAPAERLAA